MQWCVITSQTNATNQDARYITKILEQFFFFNFHLSKLHLIHPLASVPMQEGFTFKHSGELLTDPFK